MKPYRRKDGIILSKEQVFALAIAESGVRNTMLEAFHGGTFPDSATGDYSDVKVVTPFGEIPWTRLSRLSDEEMKRLMIDIVDHLYTILTNPELVRASAIARENWKPPELLESFLKLIAQTEADGEPVTPLHGIPVARAKAQIALQEKSKTRSKQRRTSSGKPKKS